jgi:hemerythrin-like domain-containing protein
VSRNAVSLSASSTRGGNGKRARAKERANAGAAIRADPADVILHQHNQLRQMFARLEGGELAIAPDLLNALALHMALEEATIYPLLVGTDCDEEVRDSIVEHAGCKRLISDLVDGPVADEAWWAAERVLGRQIEEHMTREEQMVLPVLGRRLDREAKTALMQEMARFIVELRGLGRDAPVEVALSNTDPRFEQP